MKLIINEKGFTTVELLITLFVAVIFLTSGYQLYSLTIKDGGEARAQSRANNIAYDYLQRYKSTATSSCSPQEPLTNSPIIISDLSDVTVTVAITCPYGSSTSFSAKGGNISTVNGYTIHTFTTNDSFYAEKDGSVEALVIGGGGAGGTNNTTNTRTASGGGGAGGLIYNSSNTVSSGQSISVIVGAGGLTSEAKGQDSSFGTITATGGGRGANIAYSAQTGGSGGGGSYYYPTAGLGTTGQGYNGGGGTIQHFGGSGGGGANESGYSSVNDNGTAGGGGLYYGNLFGNTVGQNGYFAGGGGGGGREAFTAGNGGIGGGGNGSLTNGNNGVNGTGGGGGGSGPYSSIGGAGGSGIVIIRYKTAIPSISKISVTIKYNNPQESVSNATYVTAQ